MRAQACVGYVQLELQVGKYARGQVRQKRQTCSQSRGLLPGRVQHGVVHAPVHGHGTDNLPIDEPEGIQEGADDDQTDPGVGSRLPVPQPVPTDLTLKTTTSSVRSGSTRSCVMRASEQGV